MCGIVGVVAKNITKPGKILFSNLLRQDVIRGPHSTGVMMIYDKEDKKAYMRRYKALGNPNNFKSSYRKQLEQFGQEILFPQENQRVLLGHNRFATQGKINKENTHPFTYGHITGVHNGTCPDHTFKNSDYYDENLIDSQLIMKGLCEVGPEEVIKDIRNVQAAAASLVWWDSKDNTLNFWRNHHRPMNYIHDKKKKSLVFSSVKPVLEMSMFMSGLENSYDDKAIEQTTVLKHYKFSFDKDTGRLNEEVEEISHPFVYPTTVNTGGTNSGSHYGYSPNNNNSYGKGGTPSNFSKRVESLSKRKRKKFEKWKIFQRIKELKKVIGKHPFLYALAVDQVEIGWCPSEKSMEIWLQKRGLEK